MKVELKDFVNRTIQELNEGLHSGWELTDEIGFEVSMITTVATGGKVDLKIASIGADQNYSAIHKIRFKISNEAKKNKNLKVDMQKVEGVMSSMFKPLLQSQQESEAKQTITYEVVKKTYISALQSRNPAQPERRLSSLRSIENTIGRNEASLLLGSNLFNEFTCETFKSKYTAWTKKKIKGVEDSVINELFKTYDRLQSQNEQ